ncbi:AAA family ATPase [Cellulosimicrobium funkei]|uniref:AAA family ATPase n=1 Tax=Cellulosimicrobium funkei TaxID=264251 RepID=UPI0036FA5C1F
MTPSLARFEVRGLFGKLDYDIRLINDAPNAKSHDLTLLYGRNGAGKSNLLRIAYHGLSASPYRGHRSNLAQIPFELARFTFSDGNELTYQRLQTSGKPVGRKRIILKVSITGPLGPLTESHNVNPDGTINVEDVDLSDGSITSQLPKLGLDPLILTDTRRIFSDAISRTRGREKEEYLLRLNTERGDQLDELVRARRDDDLNDAIERLEQFFRSIAIEGERTGAVRADQAYASIVHAISSNAQGPGRPRKSTLPELNRRLQELDSRVQVFKKYDLVTGVQFTEMQEAITVAPDRVGPLLQNVLTPYLDGMQQRMESLQEAADTIDSYVTLVNSFLDGKEVRYSALSRRLTVVDLESNDPIALIDLSSGEKQLLLLFSYVMSMRSFTQLLLIDEPEISLNPDWQRRIIPALLQLLKGTNTQLMCASHSIEILAPFDENVVDLAEATVGHAE